MTELATYDFLSYVRRGAATAISEKDPLSGALPYRAALTPTVTLRSTGDAGERDDTVSTAVELYGPADVIGIDPRHVIRTDPRAGTTTFEPNYFPSIELELPDLPWLFTPAAADGDDRVRLWLVLIVLADGEYSVPDRAPDPLPAIHVASAASLPDLSESWAWAHVQVSGGLGGSSLADVIASDPARVTSRLLCPRQLKEKTRYTGFLVPAFDLGVQAGLGEEVVAGSGTTVEPAWSAADANVLLPYYHSFSFTTSSGGDFESLARQLKPRELPAEVGIRPMDVTDPGWEMASAGGPLGLGGALRSPSTVDTDWMDPDKAAFQADLVAAVNLASAPVDDPEQDPRVVPPLYGRWHAAVSTVDAAASGWPNELNVDPRTRTVAGFGTRVVLAQRTQLLASAWEQVAGILKANQILRQAQLARSAMSQLYAQHLRPVAAGTLLSLTAPVHTRILASPITVAATIAATRLPRRALSGAFRRIARPLGPIRRRQGVRPADRSRVIDRLASGDVSVVPAPHDPGGLVSIDDASDALVPAWVPDALRPWLRWLVWIVILVAVVLALVLLLLGAVLVALVAVALGVAAATRARALADLGRTAETLRTDALTPVTFTTAPARSDFVVREAGAPAGPAPSVPPGTDSPDARAFRDAAAAVAATLQAPEPDPAPAPALDVSALATTVLARIDPEVTIAARTRSLVQVAPSLGWQPKDALEPIMAYPEFDRAMYEPLRDLSQDLLLPGLDLVPANTVSLLVEDRPFLEGYMVGLNHEMARQLIWVGYPTDQRGSYFRQFWDVRSYVPTAEDPSDPDELAESLKDIPEIHGWPVGTALGSNPNRDIPSDNLVLLVRGELLRRYPNAVVYAVEARWDDEAKERVLGDAERYPMYRGTLSPDVTFLGFDVTADDVRGSDDRDAPQGWFFVFEQQPAEPRFGLDVAPDPYSRPTVTEWPKLSWANFADRSEELAALAFAPITVQPRPRSIPADDPDHAVAWGEDAAQTAYIAFRRPVRVAIHADLMLPEAS